jgi:hypothetical protein
MRVKLAVGQVYVPSFNSFYRANASPQQNKSRVGNFPDQSGLIVLDQPLEVCYRKTRTPVASIPNGRSAGHDLAVIFPQ